jgi:putative effector of murein hydrolase
MGIRNLISPISLSRVIGLKPGCNTYSSVANLRLLGVSSFKVFVPRVITNEIALKVSQD